MQLVVHICYQQLNPNVMIMLSNKCAKFTLILLIEMLK